VSTAILMIWTIVGFGGTYNSTWKEFDWRALGEFGTTKDCQAAAQKLGVAADKFRCVETGLWKQKQ